MIAKGPLGSSLRNTKRIPMEYSEAVTLQTVEEQVNTFSMAVDEEEIATQALNESTFLEEEEAQQEIIERKHSGFPIIEEPPQVPSKSGESKRMKTNSFLVCDSLRIYAPWMQSKENDEERIYLMEFKEKFESTKRKQALTTEKRNEFFFKLNPH
ncbi:hypothetical protein M9H77_07557 [Catharanthus roseus]|uniref:Uncharacterized protein n=1 Tax=Catharanthus roseus TaxID=4058 RepID=A0ACC0BVH8_CATRO|nr:hypothetical protein M9H77_07557 [Catharanthus roseus]